MAENNEMMTGYLAGQADGKNNNGGWGGFGEGLWAVIILAMLFGGGGFGFGGFGGGGAAMLNGIATRADINEGFALQNITGGIQGIQQGICDSTYALNNAINGGFNSTQMGMMQGFNGVERGFCDLSHQMSDCCCENRMAIQQLRYDMATQSLMQSIRTFVRSPKSGDSTRQSFLQTLPGRLSRTMMPWVTRRLRTTPAWFGTSKTIAGGISLRLLVCIFTLQNV